MDSRKFRNALGQFPTGVVVATARAPTGELIGMTMSSFNSVSLDPPLILFSVHHKTLSFPAWQSIPRYAINVLNEEQEQVSNQFARSKGDKWEGISPLTGDTGVPMLPNAAVVFECETHTRLMVATTKSSSLGSPRCMNIPSIAAGRWYSLKGATGSLPVRL